MNLFGPWLRTLLRRWIWPHPAIYALINKIYRPEKISADQADIIIDGYPRSGNWFSYAALVRSQPNALVVCHHHHAPTVILEGARLGKPTLLLIRHPLAALVSAMVGQPHRTMRELLDFYLDYYTVVSPHLHHVTAATFDQVTQDFGRVTRRLNHRYGTHFVEFQHTANQVEQCFQWLAHAQRLADPDLPDRIIAHPSSDRTALRERATAKLEQALQADASFAQKMAAAEQLFQTIAKTAAVQEEPILSSAA